MKKKFVFFLVVNHVSNLSVNFFDFQPYQEYMKNVPIYLHHNNVNLTLVNDRLINTNFFPAVFTVVGAITVILVLCFRFIVKNKFIITFKDNDDQTYLTNIKRDFYSKATTQLNKGNIVDVKYICHDKYRPLLSKFCFHFNTKKFVPIKDFRIFIKRMDKKDYELVRIKNYNPYYATEDAVMRKWGIVYYDPYVEIILQEFMHKESKIIEKYEYAKGFETKLPCENVVVMFKFANGSEEEFEFHVHDENMKSQLKVHYKLERISVTKEGRLIFPYYQEFMRDCATMYMYNQELWMKTVDELYAILAQDKYFNMLVESQTDEQDELTCFREFMYDREVNDNIKEYVSTIIKKYYQDTSNMGFRKKNIIEEMKVKINNN